MHKNIEIANSLKRRKLYKQNEKEKSMLSLFNVSMNFEPWIAYSDSTTAAPVLASSVLAASAITDPVVATPEIIGVEYPVAITPPETPPRTALPRRAPPEYPLIRAPAPYPPTIPALPTETVPWLATTAEGPTLESLPTTAEE